MKDIIPLLIFITLISPITAFCQGSSQDLRQDIEQAIINGKTLYGMYMKGPTQSKEKEIENARAKITDFCEFTYQAYAQGNTIYFIAEPPSPGGIVYGRHYKVLGSVITKSTKTCYAMPKPPDNAVAAFITHLLSSAPSEFHVFLSLLYANPIYVRSEAGLWKVHKGDITYYGLPEKK